MSTSLLRAKLGDSSERADAIQRIVDAIDTEGTIMAAAEALGTDYSTLCKWRRQFPALERAISRSARAREWRASRRQR